jgi:hypothetical protein
VATEEIERRLVAILMADVAGYSRLIGIDDEGTLAQLNAHHAELIEPKIKGHRGRIVRTTGDGFLVLFVSAVDALRCGVEIQRAMVLRNAQTQLLLHSKKRWRSIQITWTGVSVSPLFVRGIPKERSKLSTATCGSIRSTTLTPPLSWHLRTTCSNDTRWHCRSYATMSPRRRRTGQVTACWPRPLRERAISRRLGQRRQRLSPRAEFYHFRGFAPAYLVQVPAGRQALF